MQLRFHLIPNAHLDPVWLWDWREGLNEGITTCRTILDLMDEDPELTFIRGESAIYQHIERHDPPTFARIRAMVESGRWDIVGGTVIQPDTNLPATETFLRHFAVGSAYFSRTFGKVPRIGWAADSFGHSGGLPDILSACGIEGYAFTRPFAGESSAFWWEGVGGGRVLAYRPPVGWYGAERDEMPRRLDALLASAKESGFVNVGVFFGIGNHGGGPTRRQLADIRAWAAQHTDEVALVPSGLHRLFDDLKAEIAGKEIPVRKGELNYCLRGCYASMARFKFAYRKAEAALTRAETVAAAIGGEGAALDAPWDTLLFNAFHDILPGTSIERATDDQIAQLGGVVHASQTAELGAVNALARDADTRVPAPDGDAPSAVPFLVVNPHPHAFSGTLEFEAGLDYRPLWAYAGRPDEVPAVLRGPDGAPVGTQAIAVENLFGPTTLPWRSRLLAEVSLPAFGWAVYTLGLEAEKAPAPEPAVQGDGDTRIGNGIFTVRAAPGDSAVVLERGGVSLPLKAVTVEDPYGSWGDMGEAPESLELSTVRDAWTVSATKVLESGPLRAKLWVRLTGGNSWLDLTFSVTAGRDAVDVAARVLWNERSARLKLSLPTGASEADFDVPGGVVTRPAGSGETPGGRWVRAGRVLWATDSLYNFDLTESGLLRATVCRASRYSADTGSAPDEAPWQPAVDAGELKFRMVVAPSDSDPGKVARELERPPLVQTVAPSPGEAGRTGTLGAVDLGPLELLALVPEGASDLLVRLRNPSGHPASATGTLRGRRLPELTVPATAIRAWRLTGDGAGGWSAQAVSARGV